MAGLLTMAVSPGVEPPHQSTFSHFSYDALRTRMPVVREHHYLVDVRVRPLLLFWVDRDNVGDARITWREGPAGHRALEFLVGSDPARAPKRINRWGFIVEELDGDQAAVLGVMSESTEQTVDEAKAQIAQQGSVSTFKASRTTAVGGHAINGTMTLRAPASLTYRDLEALLALIPADPPHVRTVRIPEGTHPGFLVAMDSLIRASLGPCRAAQGATAKDVSVVRYLYNQTTYEVSLASCEEKAELRTRTDTYADIVDGRFQLTNTTTKHETDFRILYGASGDLQGVPVRAVFRPRWWMEVELLLHKGHSR